MRKILFIFLLLTTSYSFACSCIEENISLKNKIEKAYTNTYIIFTRKATLIKDTSNYLLASYF